MEVKETELGGQGCVQCPPNWVLWLMRTLCVVALSISAYLAYQTLTSSKVAGCSAGDIWDCSHVLHSRWSKVIGLPITIPAGVVYLVMLTSLGLASARFSLPVRQWGWAGATLTAVAAGTAALWFISLQAFVLQHFCQYCMVAHTCGLILCGLIFWFKPLSQAWASSFASAGVMGVMGLITTQLLSEPPKTYEIESYEAGAGTQQLAVELDDPMLAPGAVESLGAPDEVFSAPDVMDSPLEEVSPTSATETAFPAPTDSVAVSPLVPPQPAPTPLPTDEPIAQAADQAIETEAATDQVAAEGTEGVAAASEATEATPSDSAAGSEADETSSEEAAADEAKTDEQKTEPEKPAVKADRQETYLGGRIRLNTYHWPIVGDPAAPHVLVELFDYTCPHCRTMNQHLKVARQRFGESVAILVLPVPLNRNCNDTVAVTKTQHYDACELGQLAVAVWRVAPDKFETFHNWLFESVSPRTAADARRYAEQLADSAALRAEMQKPIPSKFINQHVELYKRAGSGAIPKLLFTNITVKGEMRSADELCGLIERELKLPSNVSAR